MRAATAPFMVASGNKAITKENAVTDLSMNLEQWLVQMQDSEDIDFLKHAVTKLVHGLMELEVSAVAGAKRYERTSERVDERNGYRGRTWDTRVGSLDLRIPKLRHQGFQPSFLEPRTRAERAIFSVVQEAYIHGVSTRKVEALVQALGIEAMDKSRVSRMCSELDELVEQWRSRRLLKACPYVMFDAKYVKVRSGGCVVSKAIVTAYAIADDGYRTILGMDVFETESLATWRSFLTSLVDRGLRGVRLAVSDDHKGLVAAIREVLTGAAWQRCMVHFMRNMLGHVQKKDRDALKTVLRSIFNQESKALARQRLRLAAEKLGDTKVARLLEEAEEDILAHMSFPAEHWRVLRSTNPLERVNKEIARRTNVVGIFPTDNSVLRLVGCVLMEQDEEWMLTKRYMTLQSLALVADRTGVELLAEVA